MAASPEVADGRDLDIYNELVSLDAEREWRERHKGDINLWDPLGPAVKGLGRLLIAPINWLREIINPPDISNYGT